MGALLVALVCLVARPLHAAPTSVLVEIDGAAERLLDTRSTRRLVPLELADVNVPAQSSTRGAPVLFFRVLGRPEGALRIELWERGEYHGQRTLSGVGESPQLAARRVALAAAELGRRLARKRQAMLARDERLRVAREAREKLERERTQEGPVALRTELGFGAVPGKLSLFGSRLSGELSLWGPLRLDLGGELMVGRLAEPRWGVALEGLSLGPAYRWALGSSLDLDLGARLSALLVQVPSALELDDVPGQDSSWSARVDGAARLQLRLSRQVRASLGGELGGLLRSVRYTADTGRGLWLGGAWWGAALGVVVTPAR